MATVHGSGSLFSAQGVNGTCSGSVSCIVFMCNVPLLIVHCTVVAVGCSACSRVGEFDRCALLTVHRAWLIAQCALLLDHGSVIIIHRAWLIDHRSVFYGH